MTGVGKAWIGAASGLNSDGLGPLHGTKLVRGVGGGGGTRDTEGRLGEFCCAAGRGPARSHSHAPLMPGRSVPITKPP